MSSIRSLSFKGGTCIMTDPMETMQAQNPTISPPNTCIKNIPRNAETGTRFPKLGECAHFHYDMMDLATVKMSLMERSKTHEEANKENLHHPVEDGKGCCCCWIVQVTSRGRSWTLRRTYDNFRLLDQQLHRCVYDRQFSKLPDLPPEAMANDTQGEEEVQELLTEYLQRFSSLVGNLLNCGSVLNWLELDNRGNRLLVTDESAINTPAVAAAYVTKSYQAQALDEISFQIGDMVSVIDMPPADESTWWRGKKGFEVGFFPSECVQVIGDKIPHNLKIPMKPVFRRHGKLIAFFRSFLLSRPSRRKLKQSGILKERVFGCDLGEHLTNTGRNVPLVLTSCARFIEQYGIVDGIYRLSGITSNIQKLRVTFDEDHVPDLNEDEIRQDIHCVASLLKMYFRELPNPLLTYQLYDKFVAAMQQQGSTRLLRIRELVKELPPPHYRTLEALIRHLSTVSAHGDHTGMTAKNVAIVWAPNLLRSKDLEVASVGALHVIGVQAILTEYLICYVDLIFNDKMPVYPSSPESLQSTPCRNSRPKSLAISTPTKLLSLEEARSRALASNIPGSQQQKYIDVGGGPENLPANYHTVITFPPGKRGSGKLKKSPLGWKSFFVRGWNTSSAREKDKRTPRLWRTTAGPLPHHQSLPTQDKALTESDLVHGAPKQLRSVKSADSLISNGDHSCRGSDALDSCSSSPDASHVQPFQFLPESSSITTFLSGHRHVRSTSHDSYFERGGSGGLDLTLNDISATYDLIAQHAEHSPTSRLQMSPRKQKLTADSEGAHSKVQRLCGCKDAADDFQVSHCSSAVQAKELVSTRISDVPVGSTVCGPLHPVEKLMDRLQTTGPPMAQCTSWQPLAIAIQSLDNIGPYQSPSPQEHVPVEWRYRNPPDGKHQADETTVLVEVHAAEGDCMIKVNEEQCFAGGRTEAKPDMKEGGMTSRLNLTSLAEDIASSLKMSNYEINADFLVAVSERNKDCSETCGQLDATLMKHETGFLIGPSAVVPYIEGTGTSGVYSPHVCDHLLPAVTASGSSTPPYVRGYQKLYSAKDELCDAENAALGAHDFAIVRNVPALLDSGLRNVHVVPETAKAPNWEEIIESGHSFSDSCNGQASLLLDCEQQNSSSEDDEANMMPYARLDESPSVEIFTDTICSVLCSESQNESICLTSPVDITVQEEVFLHGKAEPSGGIGYKVQTVAGLGLTSDEAQVCFQGKNEPCIMQALNDVISQDPLNNVCTHPVYQVATQRSERSLQCHSADSSSFRNTDVNDTGAEFRDSSPVQQCEESSLVNCKTSKDLRTDSSGSVCNKNPELEQMLLDYCSVCSELENKQTENQEAVIADDPQPSKETFTMPYDPLGSVQAVSSKKEFTKAFKIESSPTDAVQLRSCAMSSSQLELKRSSEPVGSVKEPLYRYLFQPHASHHGWDKRGTVKELTSKFESTEVSPAPDVDINQKGPQPSLFTQMKVMRLLRNNPSFPSSSSGSNPWSDSVLCSSDAFVQTAVATANNVVQGRQAEHVVKGRGGNQGVSDTSPRVQETATETSKQRQGITQLQKYQKIVEVASAVEVAEVQKPAASGLRKMNAPTWVKPKVTESSEEPTKLIILPDIDSETRRQRIEKIKQERRAQLREKLKSEGFRSDDRSEIIKERTSDCRPVAEESEKILSSPQWSRKSSERNRKSVLQSTSGISMEQTVSLKYSEDGKESSLKKTGGNTVWVKQMGCAPAASQASQTAKVWKKRTTQQSEADGRPSNWSRASTGHQVRPSQQERPAEERTENNIKKWMQDPVLMSSKPPFLRTSEEPDVISKNEDLSPPKRIRDRAAMFEYRSQKEQQQPHGVAKTGFPFC